MRTKLSANQDYYPIEKLRIGYIQSRVREDAIKHLTPRFRTTASNAFAQAEKILTVLNRIYGDPNRKITVTNALRKLYQGKDTFHKFWAEF
jgi:hypothetical protein